jgi:hypothetical protein
MQGLLGSGNSMRMWWPQNSWLGVYYNSALEQHQAFPATFHKIEDLPRAVVFPYGWMRPLSPLCMGSLQFPGKKGA